MTDMRALYQEVILEHNKKPRNFGVLENATHDAHGYNPLCGDDYHIYAIVKDGVIDQVSFDGNGCAISKAAASMMTSRIKGKTVDEANTIVEEFRAMMSGSDDAAEKVGHLKVFKGVSQLPNRIKCAVLPFHTLNAALEGDQQISTEGEEDLWDSGEEQS